MGKSHLSGLSVGSSGNYSNVVLAEAVTLTAEGASGGGEFVYDGPHLVFSICTLNDANTGKAATISFGTTPGGTELVDRVTTGVSAETPIGKVMEGRVHISQSGGSFPTKVVVMHASAIKAT